MFDKESSIPTNPEFCGGGELCMNTRSSFAVPHFHVCPTRGGGGGVVAWTSLTCRIAAKPQGPTAGHSNAAHTIGGVPPESRLPVGWQQNPSRPDSQTANVVT